MIRVGLCDDDPVLLKKLNSFVSDCYAENQIFAKAQAFEKGQALLYEIEDGGIMSFDKKRFWRPADVQRVDFITELKDYGKPDQDSLIPYWRMISLRGMLIDCGRYFDKETQKELLEREGHVIEQPSPNKRLYRVKNYKAALFDLDKLIINE